MDQRTTRLVMAGTAGPAFAARTVRESFAAAARAASLDPEPARECALLDTPERKDPQ